MKKCFYSAAILINLSVMMVFPAACSSSGSQTALEANPTATSVIPADSFSDGGCRVALLLRGTETDTPAIQAGVKEAAAQNDCQVNVYAAEQQAEKMAAQINEAGQENFLGMIIMPIDNADVQTVIQQTGKAGVPVVVIGGNEVAAVQTNRVVPDFMDGARQAAGFVCGAIHEHGNVVQLVDPRIDGADGQVSKAFSEGIKTTCPEAKLTTIPLEGVDEAAAKQAMLKSLSTERDISAIFAFTESAMNGALQANQEAGILGVITAEFGEEPVSADAAQVRAVDAVLCASGNEIGRTAFQAVLSASKDSAVESQITIPMQTQVTDISFQLPPDPTTKRITIGVLLPDGSAPFYQQVYAGLLTPARSLDNVTLKVRSGNNDPKRMTQELDWMVKSGVDAILISPVEDADLLLALDRVARSGTPLVTLGLQLGMESIVSQISFDEYAMGYSSGEYLCTSMGGQGKVADIHDSANLEKEKVRSQGLQDYMQGNCPGIKITTQAFSSSAACGELQEFLSKNAMDGVFAHSDELGLCAADVSKTKYVISIGAGDKALQSIRDGKLSATLGHYPYEMGLIAMETTLEHLYGKQVEPSKPFPVNLITKDTLK
jgi:ribose transport system substrate-binding protein